MRQLRRGEMHGVLEDCLALQTLNCLLNLQMERHHMGSVHVNCSLGKGSRPAISPGRCLDKITEEMRVDRQERGPEPAPDIPTF